MKAKITEVKSYTIEIEGVPHPNFVKDSSWNGMVCYKNKLGQTVVVDDETHGFNLDKLLGGETETKPLTVMKLSPSLISGEVDQHE